MIKHESQTLYMVRHCWRGIAVIVLFMTTLIVFPGAVVAQPYGKGVYGANVPYGSQTSLSISTGGNVSIQVTPTDVGVVGTGSNTVTVTSTDVVGYSLYIRALSNSSMVNGPASLPASANISNAALAVNTWGYNTVGSATNFTGITTSNVLVKSATGPYSSGDQTAFTYGVKVDNQKPAGNYVGSVVYTAAPQTD